MSASQTPPGSPPGAAPAAGAGSASSADPSMEDILASIRRILSEDEVAAPAASPSAPPPEEAAAKSGVLVLDPSMMVPDPPVAAAPVPEPTPAPKQTPPVMAVTPPEPLIAPEVAEAAASSVGSLVRTLAAERTAQTMQVRSGGPTIEDLVREELRPLLKMWLDAHLQPMVERMVRAEIDRVVGRSAP